MEQSKDLAANITWSVNRTGSVHFSANLLSGLHSKLELETAENGVGDFRFLAPQKAEIRDRIRVWDFRFPAPHKGEIRCLRFQIPCPTESGHRWVYLPAILLLAVSSHLNSKFRTAALAFRISMWSSAETWILNCTFRYLCEQKHELQAHLQIQILLITWKLISEIFVQNSAFSCFCISRIQNKKWCIWHQTNLTSKRWLTKATSVFSRFSN